MSTSTPLHLSSSPDITYITPEPFEPKPLIADILRTRFCIPDSIFLVEGVDTAYTSKSKRWRAVCLSLGDGELCIQALLSAEMHRFVDQDEIVFGCYVKLLDFSVEWEGTGNDTEESTRREDSDDEEHILAAQSRGMVYLVVENLTVVGWHNALIDRSNIELDNEIEETIEPVEDEDGPDAIIPSTPPRISPEPVQQNVTLTASQGEAKLLEQLADADDDFETMAVSEKKSTENRSVVATNTNENVRRFVIQDPANPIKLTKLRSIPNLPYKQNWSVNVLCVIAAISEVEPAGMPPWTQRQARLADPSTDKQVLLTVFLDAQLFNPSVGSVVLLLGVKNHRFDGGCVKKYASDRPPGGGSWWFENPTQFSWCRTETEYLRRWWFENFQDG
ncbi:hypothetical protein GGR57DRAFT_475656 [Xylariaceae sp. FL1272]|nr:hypothetical protein GGR57DRAFT_475656 [Xylariaceae sp. FL1272]